MTGIINPTLRNVLFLPQVTPALVRHREELSFETALKPLNTSRYEERS
jgi:hypothetical protein